MALRQRQLHDLSELHGKTVEEITHMYGEISIKFTDGTHYTLEKEDGISYSECTYEPGRMIIVNWYEGPEGDHTGWVPA